MKPASKAPGDVPALSNRAQLELRRMAAGCGTKKLRCGSDPEAASGQRTALAPTAGPTASDASSG